MSGYTVLMHSQHSDDIDIIDASDKLQHGVPLQQIRRSYVYQKAEMNYNGYTMGSRKVPYVKVWFKTTEKPMYKDLTPDPYYAIIDVEHIPLNGNRAAAIKTELKRYFNQYDQLISDSELNKATYGALEAVNPIMDDRASDATHRPQHAGYYSPNLRVRHSLFTEIQEGDEDYLEHHGILGMKWGVRRYQNEDGSLTNAGRQRYLNENPANRTNKARIERPKTVAESYGEILRAFENNLSTKQGDAIEFKFSQLSPSEQEFVYGVLENQNINERNVTEEDLKNLRKVIQMLNMSDDEIPEEYKNYLESTDSVFSSLISEGQQFIRKHVTKPVSQISSNSSSFMNSIRNFGSLLKEKISDIFK